MTPRRAGFLDYHRRPVVGDLLPPNALIGVGVVLGLELETAPASRLKPWWVNKFTLFFRQLTKYDILDIDNDRDVHCFPRIVVGATFHKDMGVDPRALAGPRLGGGLQARAPPRLRPGARGGVPRRRDGERQAPPPHHLPQRTPAAS
ncbi:hypothetical protein GUJ93_ZPchr0011g27394 [Zizania palustris]|uniref:Uncharacterized protein n=1 Tax=Zizania palustris TaxID=103762 RepID=A0A8J5WGP5_ZIZPA|nr:hypothetical protein GUJ93_ZPchr0011g27394 [Zizania palustris]